MTSKPVKYEIAVSRGRRIIAGQTKSNWTLGDLAATVEPAYGESTIQRLADDIGIASKTLYDLRSVSQAYATSDRSENSWTVHQVLQREDDRAALVQAKIWTVREARDLVASRKAPAAGNGDGEPAGNGSKPAGKPAASGKPARATDDLAAAEAEVKRLEAELAAARDRVAAIKAARAAAAKPARKPAARKPAARKPAATAKAPAMHIVRGIPQHTADAGRADCPKCQPAAPAAAPARRRTASRTARSHALNAAAKAA